MNGLRSRLPLLLAAGLALGPVTTGAHAADFSDPDWPCIQRKVMQLSIGQMWTGPIPEGDWRAEPEVAALAPRLAQRRMPLAEADVLIADYGSDASPEELGLLVAGILDIINRERGAVISGIARYAHKQDGLSLRIEAAQEELVQLRAVEEAARDWDRIEELEDQVAWDTRIYRDRARSLTYVCETPVLLEQRAFALSRSIMTALP